MPDLAVHLLSAYIANAKLKLEPYMLLLGAMFPDIVGRTLIVLFPQSYLMSWVSALFHSVFLTFLAAYLVILFFSAGKRRSYFVSLSAGIASHLFLDLLQKHYTEAYYWFFPFSFRTAELPLLWGDDFGLLIPFLAVIAGCLWWRDRKISA